MSEHTFLTATSPFDKRLARLKEIISESKKITFFGGAGVSTGSGIPTSAAKTVSIIICLKK